MENQNRQVLNVSLPNKLSYRATGYLGTQVSLETSRCLKTVYLTKEQLVAVALL